MLIEKKDILLIKDKPELDKNESLYIIRIHNRYFSEKNFEASLLYLCRAIRDKSAFCLFLAEEAPTKWSVSLPDLRSRVAAVPSEAISLPDDNVLEAVLRKCLSDNELIITHEVAKFIASRIDRSFSYAQLVVNKINELALIAQKSCISYSIAKEALDELEKEKQEK
ncbi:hypothetical protein HYD_1500 [Candidatus Hydrogenosomobacter endosymbioticus]|uniref:Uncharacterized protein n=1 Tax=Candidatus Hydrogenosomobacter endosymbioticus TaxID=2558174 RepID=A0ABM7V8A7_9PROT|nr:hypothetical protein HYD_1500 [Candidatus Hydrogenosomobacter endosymbioticus]